MRICLQFPVCVAIKICIEFPIGSTGDNVPCSIKLLSPDMLTTAEAASYRYFWGLTVSSHIPPNIPSTFGLTCGQNQ